MTERELQQQLGQIEELVAKLEQAPDSPLKSAAKELVQLLMDIHGAGLARLIEIASQSGDVGFKMINDFGNDELARHLLFLYGLHPVPFETRVQQALASVHPYLASRGANAELLRVAEGVVQVRLLGNAHGCTAGTLKSVIEDALYKAAPDLVSISVETDAPESISQFIPLEHLLTSTAALS